MTLSQLASRVGVSPAQLSKIENGKSPLDLGQLGAFASVLGVAIHHGATLHFTAAFDTRAGRA